MRFTLIVFGWLGLAAPVWAAPVKADPKADLAHLESLWQALGYYDWQTRVPAIFELIDHPKAAAFLEKKIQPLNASKAQIVEWMEALNSADEDVRTRAVTHLRYHAARLQLDLAEQLELARTQPAKRQLLELWNQYFEEEGIPNSVEVAIRIEEYKGNGGEVRYAWTSTGIRDRNNAPFGQGRIRIDPVREYEPNDWVVAALAAIILDRIGTKPARDTLARIANGHPEALPTRIARGLQLVGPPAPLPANFWTTEWIDFPNLGPIHQTRALFAMIDQPEAIGILKSKLPAIKAEKNTIQKWLGELGSEDAPTRKAAVESLRYFHPSLACTVYEQVLCAHNDRARSAFFPYYFCDSHYDPYTELRGSAIVIGSGRLNLVYRPGGVFTSYSALHFEPLELMTPSHWQRARLAIIAMERNASEDAIAGLKQLADGHPGILPTKEAKAALKKLGK